MRQVLGHLCLVYTLLLMFLFPPTAWILAVWAVAGAMLVLFAAVFLLFLRPTWSWRRAYPWLAAAVLLFASLVSAAHLVDRPVDLVFGVVGVAMVLAVLTIRRAYA